MKNKLSFEKFINSLQATNRHLDFYVDWEKCLKNKDEIEIALNHLNLLLGVGDNELKGKIEILFKEYPKAFSVLPLLIAVRDADNEKLFNSFGQICNMNSYLKTPHKIYEFIYESGLFVIFFNKKIKDLNDFVFGVEVGLDTNARKNRSGNAMENLISNIFTNFKLNFKKQVKIEDLKEIEKIFGLDVKKFDFVIFTSDKIYCIECNFYTSGGSKLNEVARAYQELAPKFDQFPQYEFIWITDGYGWLDAKNKLEEAYEKVEIYNLSNINDFILKVKNV
ncbi:restriction endonuclease [Campylobacter lari]|uniref:type II restriction endonuclease n=1 Tax=unclassified Campylobacter TaxID=2593542 RepID=UPI0021E8345D|nr:MULTISPECIES: type II restriction endonuclease [unclassified Campylobacter]EGK8096543.1 restriction endonuclease [Campylobacter lari]MCV3337345.1 type II restriction endonuclease [Campylobacter sp. RKI_CA19_01121]MCV3391924.1 type II restriction endonuclease [Campylobacter sp. IFREMER_LSEM_CL2101]HEF1622890.1 type II restriction endonuclease [Campylobacter lari]